MAQKRKSSPSSEHQPIKQEWKQQGEPEPGEGVEESLRGAAELVDEDLVTVQNRLRELEAALETALKECEEQRNLYLRTLADFHNYRRRQQEEIGRGRLLLLEDFVIQLLPILDNFERALAAAEAMRDFASLVEGVQLTLRQIQDLLARYEIQPIEAIGQRFDPNLHEAVQRIETTDYPDGTVVDEVQRGYQMGDRVIRPSRVIVAYQPSSSVSEGGFEATV